MVPLTVFVLVPITVVPLLVVNLKVKVPLVALGNLAYMLFSSVVVNETLALLVIPLTVFIRVPPTEISKVSANELEYLVIGIVLFS